MAEEVRLWQVDGEDTLRVVPAARLNLEERIEKWVRSDISLLDSSLLVIGQQVRTDLNKKIDLLCMDGDGDLVIVELKRGMTPREVTAQALEYAAWVNELDAKQVTEIADDYFRALGSSLEAAFEDQFDRALPEEINGRHAIRIVASAIDRGTERIIRYLSESYGVDINAAQFHLFETEDGRQLLGRIFTIAEDVAESNSTKQPGKRRPILTLQELQQAAEGNGVGEIYRQFFQLMPETLIRVPNQNFLSFDARWPDGKRKTVLSIDPKGSGPESGLRYRLYLSRLADLNGVAEDDIRRALPSGEEWKPWSGGGSGRTGFMRNAEDADSVTRAVLRRPT